MSFVETKKKLDAEKEAQQYEQYNVTATINAGIRMVRIAGVPVGIANSDEDEKHMVDTLRHYGTDLSTPERVYEAIHKMQKSACVATDLRDSGMNVEAEYYTDAGTPVFQIDGKLYDENGHVLAK